MRTFRITMLLIATSMLLCACPKDENEHHYITIINQSDKTIVWQARIMRIGETEEKYDCQRVNRIINKDSTYKFEMIRHSWEKELNGYYLQIMLMDAEIFEQYVSEPCDTIRQNVPILHIYRLTLADLQQMNWTVVFPPKE